MPAASTVIAAAKSSPLPVPLYLASQNKIAFESYLTVDISYPIPIPMLDPVTKTLPLLSTVIDEGLSIPYPPSYLIAH
ncbi:MAG: hypothetical protein M3R36_06035 [Bacteroidota bacterium]|nr:hypothetical protein [Bacteroidota bacterium]